MAELAAWSRSRSGLRRRRVRLLRGLRPRFPPAFELGHHRLCRLVCSMPERHRRLGQGRSPWPHLRPPKPPPLHPQIALVGDNVGNSPILWSQTRLDARGWVTLRVTLWPFFGRPDLSESVRNHPITRWYPAGFSLFWRCSTSGQIRPKPAPASVVRG